MSCGACKMSGGAMPLSYVNPSYREPSAYAGSDRVISQAGLARPSLNLTGGYFFKKSMQKTRGSKGSKRSRKTRRRGGFYPSIMGSLLHNGPRLIPAAAVTGYRMVKNYKKRSTRKNRK